MSGSVRLGYRIESTSAYNKWVVCGRAKATKQEQI